MRKLSLELGAESAAAPSLKTKLLLAFVSSIATALAELPERITEAELTQEANRYAFGQYIQMEDGIFTSEMGRVIIEKREAFFALAFYKKEGATYVRLGKPIEFHDTKRPFVSARPDLGVPCISAWKKDQSAKIHAYVLKGKPTMSETSK